MKLYSNDNYKCPICNKYIVCTSFDLNYCLIDSTNTHSIAKCKLCKHNYRKKKNQCTCTIITYMTYIDMLRNELLESSTLNNIRELDKNSRYNIVIKRL